MKAVAIALSLGFFFGASGAWWQQSQRYGLQIEKLKHASTQADLVGARKAVTVMAGFQKGMNDALANFQATSKKNALAQKELDRLLLDLRSTTAGLRGDFTGLAGRISAAAQPALAEYANTCTAVFEAMAAGGSRLAEAGAEITRQADGHAADARLMHHAWPK